jgi:type IV pilus assembly protein PilB
MIDVPLGTLIFRAGLLGEEQLEDALREGMRTGRRLGEVLIERGLLEERDLGRLLAGQKGLPFVEVSASDAEPAALELLSEDNARHHVALPLRHEGGQVVVAVADPSNELMLENLRRMLGAPPKLVVAPYAELVKAIAEAYARPRPEAAPELEVVVAEPGTPEPKTQPEPPAEVERAPVRPLPIMFRPQGPPAAELKPASTKLPSPPMLLPSPAAPPSVEKTPQVETPAAEAVEKTPAVVQPPPAPELILELPPDWPSAGEEPADEPASPAPPPEEPAPEPAAQDEPSSPAPPREEAAPEPAAQDEPASLTAVILRLQDGTTLEVGTFPTVAEAAAEAQEVVIEIAAADRNSTWPFFAQRYLRPDLIISVDLIEQGSVNDGLRRSQR